ncbi:hypothetical protein LX69_02328 [Breznakibacter xylanolyticus]|uniref:DUF7033 domain-containing protein n=2 Tax=Breznakibacter xylanolyticus TaxID=990 RepID=A0A2W7N4L1_9BACT|nr:hypothetical protein LX69_02328 [Breznakibacter xylanolyticus]
MNRLLNKQEVDYVLFHLGHHCTLHDELRARFSFESWNECGICEIPQVHFYQSNKAMQPVSLIWLQQSVPVLFPQEGFEEWFSFDDNGHLYIRQDIIKSAFFFLSGLQEYDRTERDEHGRFLHRHSLQHALGVGMMPVVNYYFDVLVHALSLFCQRWDIPFERKRLFSSFGFWLSHDVDRLAYFSLRQTLKRMLQYCGIKQRTSSRNQLKKDIVRGLAHLIFPHRFPDPWQNILSMAEDEAKLGIRSTYFLLFRQHYMDGRVGLKPLRHRQMIESFRRSGAEVGLHGSYASMHDAAVLRNQIQEFEQAAGFTPAGIRQHYLRTDISQTLASQLDTGFQYDATLGFADAPGYRNGYCYPFKPFDFSKQSIMDIWELPLMLMEVSVLEYQQGDFEHLQLVATKLADEAEKFGGFVSLLWHNCRLREEDYPGVSSFYPNLIREMMVRNAESITGCDLVKLIRTL